MIESYPLCWPAGWKRTPSAARTTAQFHGHVSRPSGVTPGATYKCRRELSVAEATDRLRVAVARMRGAGLTISTNVELRRDGLPRSDRRDPTDPGAAAYWTTAAGQPRCMAIDQYDRVADNLAAIAGTLEALRAVERYGGAAILERAFTGFQALPETAGSAPWTLVLGVPEGASTADIRAAHRRAALDAHPDRAGGDHEKMLRVNAALAEGLRAAGGGA